jgi:DNA-binding transcriptional ArsR family regulator
MSNNFSMLLLWSKGAFIRKKILSIIADAQEKNDPIFVSEIAKIYNVQIGNHVTVSGIRKHIKILLQYGLIYPINKGGRPEYLKLSDKGKNALDQIRTVEKNKESKTYVDIKKNKNEN